MGDAQLQVDSQTTLPLKNVLVVPRIVRNLLFVSQLTQDLSCTYEFFADGFRIKDKATG